MWRTFLTLVYAYMTLIFAWDAYLVASGGKVEPFDLFGALIVAALMCVKWTFED
jgi:hypothetical protein